MQISVCLVLLVTIFIAAGEGYTLAALQYDVTQLKADVISLKTELAALKKKVESEPIETKIAVAFTATAGSTDILNLQYGSTIVFPVVVTNYSPSGGYNKNNGKFTAPVRGMYLFTATLVTNTPASHIVDATINKNGEDQVKINCQDKLFDDSCSATLTTFLESGDTVSVVNRFKTNAQVDTYSSFSGMLIQQW